MAQLDLAVVNPALEQRFRPHRRHQANRSAVTLNLLNKTRAYGIKNWSSRITTGTDVGQVFSDGQDFTVFNNDDDTPIILSWSLLGDTWNITNLAEDGASGDPGDFSVLFAKAGADSLDKTAKKVNQEIWTGPGTAGPQRIHGLLAAGGPLDDTGVYAGVDRTAVSQWASNNFDNAGFDQPFSIDVIESAADATYTASGMRPDCHITTVALWRRYKKLSKQEALEREIRVGGEQYKLDPGVQALLLDGVPIFMDADCPEGTWVGLSMQDIGIERLMPAQQRRNRKLIADDVPIVGTPEEQYWTVNEPGRVLGAEIYRIANTGNHEKYIAETKIVLWSERNNSHMSVRNLVLS